MLRKFGKCRLDRFIQITYVFCAKNYIPYYARSCILWRVSVLATFAKLGNVTNTFVHWLARLADICQTLLQRLDRLPDICQTVLWGLAKLGNIECEYSPSTFLQILCASGHCLIIIRFGVWRILHCDYLGSFIQWAALNGILDNVINQIIK